MLQTVTDERRVCLRSDSKRCNKGRGAFYVDVGGGKVGANRRCRIDLLAPSSVPKDTHNPNASLGQPTTQGFSAHGRNGLLR